MQTEITVSVENIAPNGGQMIAPIWVALHDGSFDLFDEGTPASIAIEAMAEDGIVGNLPSEAVEQLIDRGIDLEGLPAPEDTIAGTFASSQAAAQGGVQNVVFSSENLPDQLPGETTSTTFTLNLDPINNRFFSYAGMLIPTNDGFIGNDDPTAIELFDENNNFIGAEFLVLGNEVWDAGTEVNDEDPISIPYDLRELFEGVAEGGVIQRHPGLLPPGAGGILDFETEEGTSFPNADFLAEGYQVARIRISGQPVAEEPTEFGVIEELLSSISTGERNEFLSLQTTDVVWEVEGNEVPVSPTEVRDTEVIPFAGNWFGTIGISQTAGDFFDELQSSLNIETFQPLDFFREGEQALARVHLEATVTETGLPLDLDLAYRIELETTDDGRELVESVQLVYNSYPVAEAFVGQEPSAEAIALSERDPLTGVELSIDAEADSEASLQVVREAYEALQVGDIEGYIDAFAEDSIVTLNADPAILATGNVWEGQDGLEELLTEVVPSLDFSIRAINPTDIIANGDRVAVFTNWENSNSRTGLNGSFPLTQFLTVQDGEIINGQFIFDTHIPATLLSGEPVFELEPDNPTTVGEDLVFGGTNDDLLDSAANPRDGFDGNGDLVFAGSGDDLIDNSTGASGNRIYAGGGDDTIFAGTGDRILGQDGNDRFFFPAGGDNLVTGGTGNDQFWIANGFLVDSPNTITDFTSDEDVLGVGGIENVTEFDDLVLLGNSDTTISVMGNDIAILLGVTPDSLSADDFVFAAGFN